MLGADLELSSTGTSIGTLRFGLEMKTLTLIMYSNLYPLTNTGFINGRAQFLCDLINGVPVDICAHIFQILGKTVDTIFCPPSICVLDLEKSKKYYFLSMGPRDIKNDVAQPVQTLEHPKYLFSTKMTKMPLVNLRLTEGKTRSKLSQNNTFHSFTSNPSFSDIFGKLDQA